MGDNPGTSATAIWILSDAIWRPDNRGIADVIPGLYTRPRRWRHVTGEAAHAHCHVRVPIGRYSDSRSTLTTARDIRLATLQQPVNSLFGISGRLRCVQDKASRMGALKRWVRKARDVNMAKPCSHMCSKAYLIIFNLVFLLCGGATLALGIWVKYDKETFLALQIVQGAHSGLVFERIPYILIGVGAAMIILCFAGGCGACAESVCFLYFYSIILFLLVLAQIIVTILAVARRKELESEFATTMLHQVRIRYNRSAVRDVNKTDFLTFAWDAMQVELSCCGAEGPGDYMFSTWWNHTKNSAGMAIPHTCCELYNDNPEVPMVRDNNQCQIEGFIYKQWKERPEEVGPMEELHTKGCVDAVLEWIDEHSDIIVTCIVISTVLQALGVFTSCFLIYLLKREHGKDWTDEDE